VEGSKIRFKKSKKLGRNRWASDTKKKKRKKREIIFLEGLPEEINVAKFSVAIIFG